MIDERLKMVQEFHDAFGVHRSENPDMTDTGKVKLRVDLIDEEYREYQEADERSDKVGILDALCDLEYVCLGALDSLGLAGLPVLGTTNREGWITLIRRAATRKDSGLMAIGLRKCLKWIQVHVRYHGFADVFHDAFAHVHASNMSKLQDDGTPLLRGDGKVLKGPNYWRPSLTQFLPS